MVLCIIRHDQSYPGERFCPTLATSYQGCLCGAFPERLTTVLLGHQVIAMPYICI